MTAPSRIALVLTARPGSGCIDTEMLAGVRGALAGAAVQNEAWLAQGEAWELQFEPVSGTDLGALRTRVAGAAGSRPADINLVPLGAGPRRKRLLVADMEATIIEQECLDELADFVGLRERISAITQRAMRGELDFEAALKERVALLKGLGADVLEAVYARVTPTPGAATLVATMHRSGAACALVSGGFTFFAERVAARLGFDSFQANVLEMADGHVAGTVAMPILGREAKAAALERLREAMGLAAEDTLAVGDGANDLAMLKAAGLGVAFHAKPMVAAEARASIVHGDLTSLLYLQGYRRDEFVT